MCYCIIAYCQIAIVINWYYRDTIVVVTYTIVIVLKLHYHTALTFIVSEIVSASSDFLPFIISPF